MSQYNFNFECFEQASLADVNGIPGNSMVDTDIWFNEPYATSSTTSWDEEQRPVFVGQTDASFTLSTSGSASPGSGRSMTPFLDPQLLNAVASSSLKPARANHRYNPYPASKPHQTSLSPPSPRVQNDGFFAAGPAQPSPLDGAFPFPGQPSLSLQQAPSATYPPMEYWTASSSAGMTQQWDARTQYILGWADSLPNPYAQHPAGLECIPDGFQYIPDASATGFNIPPSYPYDATPGPSQPYPPYFQHTPSVGPPPQAQNIHAADPGPSRRRTNHSSGMRMIPGGMPQPSAYPVSSLPAPPLTHAHAQYPTASPPSDSTPPEPRHPQPTRSRKRRAPEEDEDEWPRVKRRKSGPSRAEQSSTKSQVVCTPAGVQQPAKTTFDTEEPEDDLQSLAAPNHVTHGAAGPPEDTTDLTPQQTSQGKYLCLVAGCKKTCTTLDDVRRHVGSVKRHASFRRLEGWDAFMLKYGIKERHLNDFCPVCGVVERRDTSGRHSKSKIHLRNLKLEADRKAQSNGECLLTDGAPEASSSKAPVGVDREKSPRKSGNSTGKAPRSTKGRTRTHQL